MNELEKNQAKEMPIKLTIYDSSYGLRATMEHIIKNEEDISTLVQNIEEILKNKFLE